MRCRSLFAVQEIYFHPWEQRFRLLADHFKKCKAENLPVDEVTVFELLEPVHDVRDVRDMAVFLGIDPVRE